MKVVFLGTPEFAVPSLIALDESPHPILAVITQPDRPAGRGQHLRASAVKRVALQRGLTVIQPDRLDDEAVEQIAALGAEVVVVVAYGLILPSRLLGVPPRGCINLHASLLPRYRGAAPVAHAILHGETVTGVTTLLMDEGIDTGPILMQRESTLGGEETTGEVEARLAEIGARLLAETLAGLERGSIRPRMQQVDRKTYAPKLKAESARLDWRKSAGDLLNCVRAFNPRPGAFAHYHRRMVKIWRAAEPAPAADVGPPPGSLLSAEGRLRVVCGGCTTLELREVQMEGRQRVSGEEALRGRWFSPGECFDGSSELDGGRAGPPPAGV